jgi:cytochrome c peroxidase
MLYFEERLSRNGAISCDSCHPLARYGADGAPTSVGFGGSRGTRNSPSVYNAALQFVQFWDGRAPSVEEQAKGPILNPSEMAMASQAAIVELLNSIPQYVAAFRNAFPGDPNPVTFDHTAIAIGAFERKLITPSRWDRYLKGDRSAMAAAELSGFDTFVEEGCAICHAGVLVGGDSFRRLGAVRSYPDGSDSGRYGITKKQIDHMLFKVPSLRNVAATAPYFHNGKVPTLAEAVRQMSDYQLGKGLKEDRVEAIVTWLNCLTGDLPAAYVQRPELPPALPRTPAVVP